MVWERGHRLFGDRYIVQKKLGQGGFGITYLVEDKNGKLLVVKTLKDEVMTDPNLEEYRDKYLRDFDREALKLAICNHPHIVRVENHFYEKSLPCLVMEYIRGEDLWRRIKKGKNPLPEAEATRYIQQIGEALTVIHEKGLLHRDVKPHNIMIRNAGYLEDDEAVLIDFGIAREFIPDLTQTQSVFFTQGFAPLEQYDEQARRGEFTDVYAMAATFYCLVTGKTPPPAFTRVVNDKLLPPQDVNPEISDAASEAMLAGLQLHPEDRPQSVSEWLWLLDDDLSSERGVDYRRLRDLLKAGEWEEADGETYRCMSKTAGKDHMESFDIDTVPCTDLRTIDRLWVKYSRGRFGFSVLQRIYLKEGGTRKYNEAILKDVAMIAGWWGGYWAFSLGKNSTACRPWSWIHMGMQDAQQAFDDSFPSELIDSIFEDIRLSNMHNLLSRADTCDLCNISWFYSSFLDNFYN